MSEFWSAAQLAVFARVVELNGFSAAARAYGVPKVAVSRAIADLEKSMGVQLLKRTTRRIFLTAAGDAVLPHARAIGIEVEKVRQLAQSFLPTPGGDVFATLDGQPIVFDPRLSIVRTQSPVFTAAFPADNIFALDPTLLTGHPTVSDGYWVMLPPLAPGPTV